MNFFSCMKEFNDTTLFQMNFHDRNHFARLMPSLMRQSKNCYWQEDSSTTSIVSTLAFNDMSQHNEIVGHYFQSDSLVLIQSQLLLILNKINLILSYCWQISSNIVLIIDTLENLLDLDKWTFCFLSQRFKV